jgi:RNA polymerase sigma-70 factor (ECF subfamily)
MEASATLTAAESVIAPGDLALARAAALGERLAVDEILRRMQCVTRFVSAQNEQLGRALDASALEDVVQEVMILVWRKLAVFEGRSTLESWVFRICQLEVLAALRKRRRQPELAAETQMAEVASPEDVSDVFAIERVIRLLESLPAESHRVLRLKHFDQLTFEEIAQRLVISPNTAKTLYYRALLRLRGQFRLDDSSAAVGA